MFHVGQQVVYIDDRPFEEQLCPFVKGRVYQVAGICDHFEVGLGLHIVGHILKKTQNYCTCVRHERFRPVCPQSIEWAREIARDVKQLVRENA